MYGTMPAKVSRGAGYGYFDTINMNRKSPSLLPKYGEVFCGMIHASLLGQNLQETCEKAGAALGLNVKKMMQYTREDPMCACYIAIRPFPLYCFICTSTERIYRRRPW